MSVEMFQTLASKLTSPVWPVSLKIVGDVFDARQKQTRLVWPPLQRNRARYASSEKVPWMFHASRSSTSHVALRPTVTAHTTRGRDAPGGTRPETLDPEPGQVSNVLKSKQTRLAAVVAVLWPSAAPQPSLSPSTRGCRFWRSSTRVESTWSDHHSACAVQLRELRGVYRCNMYCTVIPLIDFQASKQGISRPPPPTHPPTPGNFSQENYQHQILSKISFQDGTPLSRESPLPPPPL